MRDTDAAWLATPVALWSEKEKNSHCTKDWCKRRSQYRYENVLRDYKGLQRFLRSSGPSFDELLKTVQSFRPQHGPGVDSASNRNEYRGYLHGGGG